MKVCKHLLDSTASEHVKSLSSVSLLFRLLPWHAMLSRQHSMPQHAAEFRPEFRAERSVQTLLSNASCLNEHTVSLHRPF